MPLNIDAKTGLVALLGWPVSHSLSPAMHNAGFKLKGWNLAYLAFAVRPEEEAVSAALTGLNALGCVGLNVTVPHKEMVCRLVDQLDKSAKHARAVNAVLFRDGRSIGFNTDGAGFIASLRERGFSPEGKSVLIFGAGGAARGVTLALAGAGASSIVIANRTLDKGENIARDINRLGLQPNAHAIPLESALIKDIASHTDLVINTTPLGLHPGDIPVWDDFSLFPSHTLVVDLIYNPEVTPFLRLAHLAGLTTMNGLGMLVHQAALAWNVWFGCPGPVDVFYKAARSASQSNNQI